MHCRSLPLTVSSAGAEMMKENAIRKNEQKLLVFEIKLNTTYYYLVSI